MTDLLLAEEFDDASRAQWLALVEKVLQGAPFDSRLVSSSVDGIEIQPLYTRGDALAGADGTAPGPGVLARGLPNAGSGQGWDIRQCHGGADPKAVNRAILADLSGGVSSITLQISAPGQSGLPLEPAAMVAALKGVDLSICPVGLAAGGNFGAAAAYLLGAWATQKIAPDARRGCFNADPLGTMAANGGLNQPPAAAIASAATLVAKVQELPGVTAMIADGRPYHNAGASEAQELAAMLATFVAYLRGCETAGLTPAQVLPKIAVGLAADTDQFLTIAKLRAARVVLGRLAQAVGAADQMAAVQIEVTTSMRMMTRRDPWVNMLRTTIACAGAAMGGADAITVLPFTAALGAPDAFARRIARNTQIVLQEESHLGRVADPAGGSWYVEKLTDDLARAAWQQFQEIEAGGGMACALISEVMQENIAKSADERERQLSFGERAITGVSAFAKLGDDDVNAEPVDTGAPVESQAIEVRPMRPRRLAAPYEHFRFVADCYAAEMGKPPQIFIAKLGPADKANARAAWVKNFFASGGFEVIDDQCFMRPDKITAAFGVSGTPLVCIAPSDEFFSDKTSMDMASVSTAQALDEAGAAAVYYAGKGGEAEAIMTVAGITGFVHASCDALAMFKNAYRTLGVKV